MFEIGDKVVCVEKTFYIEDVQKFVNTTGWINTIKLYHPYTIISITKQRGERFLYFDDTEIGLCEKGFISLVEFRKLQLKKICSNQETK